MKIITLIFAMFIVFSANAQKLLTDSVSSLYTTHYDTSLYYTTYKAGWATLDSIVPTKASVIDNKGITVASVDSSGILTVMDSLATIKAFFNGYYIKIKGYNKKYYYTWAYQSDSKILLGSDVIQSPTLPTKDYIIKHTHLFDTLDKDKLVIYIKPTKNPAD